MFLFKKIVAAIFSPLSMIIGLMGVGLFFIWFTKKQKTGKILITSAAALLLILSYHTVADSLLRPLEQRFPPLMLDSRTTASADTSSVKWIAVLGGGHTRDQYLPVTSEISEESLVRLAEAIRIYKKIPGSKIILSGGAVFNRHPEAETLLRTAQMLNETLCWTIIRRTLKNRLFKSVPWLVRIDLSWSRLPIICRGPLRFLKK
jgi:uncharacterized SAM-binding protein YcdF (DUF218 family)